MDNCRRLQRELIRCDREIAEMLNQPEVMAGTAPAWLVALGVSDWQAEKRLIEEELLRAGV
jgi:hypothetical protein